MEQVWNNIHQNNFVVLKLPSGLVKVLEAHDLVTFERARHHGLILDKTPLNRLDYLFGRSVIFCHEETRYWLKPLSQARLNKDFFNHCPKALCLKAFFNLGLPVNIELIVCEDQVH